MTWRIREKVDTSITVAKSYSQGDRGSKTLQVVLVLMLTDLPMQALIVMNRSRLFEHINGSGG